MSQHIVEFLARYDACKFRGGTPPAVWLDEAAALLREVVKTPTNHAPGDLRQAFVESVAAYEGWENGTREPAVELHDHLVPISEVIDLLSNCSDPLPSDTWQQLLALGASDTIAGSSYGDAARWLKDQIRDET
jgi:hypothetical protein